MSNYKISQFKKVSFEQFLGDYIEAFELKPEIYEVEMIRQIYMNIVLPERATTGSAGYDFKSPIDIELNPSINVFK